MCPARSLEAWGRIRAGVEHGVLGEIYAGLWIAENGQCLVVAVTNQPEHAAATLRDIAPEAPLRVVWRRHPLAMLEALADKLIEMGRSARGAVRTRRRVMRRRR